MRNFIIWLIIDVLCLSEMVCAYTDHMVPLSILLAILLGIISIMIMLYAIAKRKKQLMVTMSAVPFSVMIAFMLFNYQQCQRIENAKVLIQAVENYKKEHRQYPASLHQLIPEQLPNLPENHFGLTSRDYEYHKHRDSYDIKVETDSNSGMRWLSKAHTWAKYN